VRLLQDAFDRKHIHVRCSALVNDVSRTRAKCADGCGRMRSTTRSAAQPKKKYIS
jgi:hypothetical protein